MSVIAEILVHPGQARVYEHGWQSWGPTTTYAVTETSHRPRERPELQTMCWRPGRPGPAGGFQGEGLLAVDPGGGSPVRLFAARDGLTEVPSIRAVLHGERLVVSADGPVEELSGQWAIETALETWADAFAARAKVPPPRAAPSVWCSWYHYFGDVTAEDVVENLDAISAHELPVDVVQIDDGWQAEIGDWLRPSGRFASLPALIGGIRESGRRAGAWVAPFLVGARSVLAGEHPDWLVRDADAGRNWDQDLYALDVTHPGAQTYLRQVFTSLCELGIDYFKLDFLYAGALDGQRYSGASPLAAYRQGLALVREAVGPEPYVLGSGAPILPSAGLVDAMRVSPDIGLTVEPPEGDLSRPSQRAATLSTIGRAWQHGRLWVNDPDCLIVRPEVAEREAWARTVERFGGLRASSDRVLDLDDWGLETTRRLLAAPPPPTPFPSGREPH